MDTPGKRPRGRPRKKPRPDEVAAATPKREERAASSESAAAGTSTSGARRTRKAGKQAIKQEEDNEGAEDDDNDEEDDEGDDEDDEGEMERDANGRPTGKRKYARWMPEAENIIEGSRKRRRVLENSKDFVESRLNETPERKYTPEQVQELGREMLEKLQEVPDPDDAERLLHWDFVELPSREDYPDYYATIKHPICFDDVDKKLAAGKYRRLASVRDDLTLVFTNAKKYNQTGSLIYEAAKVLQRELFEVYEELTDGNGDSDVDDPPAALSQLPTVDGQPVKRKRGRPPRGDMRPFPEKPSDTSYSRRGPTLKPWLNRKLFETMQIEDGGRKLADAFRDLPERQHWPEYYQYVQQPMSFKIVNTKIQGRKYNNVDEFAQDVRLIFSNALYFNESGSRVYKDAKILQHHFGEIMKEAPPEFVPPRKYNTARRRAEAARAAAAASASPAPPGDVRVSSPARALPSTSRSPSRAFSMPYAPPPPPNEEYLYADDVPVEDTAASLPVQSAFAPPPPQRASPEFAPFDLPGSLPGSLPGALPGVMSPGAMRSPPQLPAVSLPEMSPGRPRATSFLRSPSASTSALAPAPPAATAAVFASPAPPLSRATSANSTTTTTTTTDAVAAMSGGVSKMPSRKDQPSIVSLEIKTDPPSAPLRLSHETVRQHSFGVPRATRSIEFWPVFRPPARSNKKGVDTGSSSAPPSVRLCVRPATATFEVAKAVTEGEAKGVDEDAGDDEAKADKAPGGGEVHYVLLPTSAFTTAEIVLGDDEVFRYFITR